MGNYSISTKHIADYHRRKELIKTSWRMAQSLVLTEMMNGYRDTITDAMLKQIENLWKS